MFTPEDRTRLRDALVAAARADPRITGCALTGSAAAGAEDRWSDIDLALAVTARADRGQVVADWTERMYREGGAVHHLDVYLGDTLFRVFLLADTLQVDLAFWAADQFGAYGPNFRLLFGTAAERPHRPQPSAAGLIGWAWLYALHARSSIERGRAWQAEYMVSGMRDQVLALACLRHGLPAAEGRGIDRLPPEDTAALAGGLVRSLDPAELRRAFGVVTEALIAEAGRADAGLAGRLAPLLRELAGKWPPAAPPHPTGPAETLQGG
jgi:predicted nucleotidyltransferase